MYSPRLLQSGGWWPHPCIDNVSPSPQYSKCQLILLSWMEHHILYSFSSSVDPSSYFFLSLYCISITALTAYTLETYCQWARRSQNGVQTFCADEICKYPKQYDLQISLGPFFFFIRKWKFLKFKHNSLAANCHIFLKLILWGTVEKQWTLKIVESLETTVMGRGWKT